MSRRRTQLLDTDELLFLSPLWASVFYLLASSCGPDLQDDDEEVKVWMVRRIQFRRAFFWLDDTNVITVRGVEVTHAKILVHSSYG